MKGTLLLLASVLLLVNPAYGLEIANFKSGLLCTDGKTFGQVCYEISDIYVTGQAECSYNKKPNRCTWYGYSFDYKGAVKSDVITCKYHTDQPGTAGNPMEIFQKNTTEYSYDIKLNKGDGSYFNPQYMLLSPQKSGSPIFRINIECSWKGKKLFSTNYRIHQPLIDE